MATGPQLRRASARLEQKANATLNQRGNSQGDRSRVVQAQDEKHPTRKRRRVKAETPSIPNSDSEDNIPVDPAVRGARARPPVAPPRNLVPDEFVNPPNPHPPPPHNYPAPYMMPQNYPYPYMTLYQFPQGPNPDGNQPPINGPAFPPQNAPAWNAHQLAHALNPVNYVVNAAAFYQPNAFALAVIPPEFHQLHQPANGLFGAPRPIDRDDADQHDRPRNPEEDRAYDQRHGIILTSYDRFTDSLSVILKARGRSFGRVVELSEPLPACIEYVYWPMFTGMAERDGDPDILEAELEARVEDIRCTFREWRAGLEKELSHVREVGMNYWWHEEQDTADKVKNFREEPLPWVTLSTSLDDTLEATDGDTRTEVLSRFSPEFQALLAADAIFTTPKSKSGLCFYPMDLETLQNDWYYSGPWEVVGKGAESVEMFKRALPGKPQSNTPAIKVARRFLRELGCIGALHPEMSAQGDTFICARCSDLAEPVGWKDIISHYVKEHDSWKEIMEKYPDATSHPSIKYNNVHDFSNYDEPTVHRLSGDEVIAHLESMDDRTGVLLYCKLCIRLGIMFAKSGRVPLESHVKNAHSIQAPELLKHYGPCRDF